MASGKVSNRIPLTSLTTPVGLLSLLQLTIQNRFSIAMLSMFSVDVFVCSFLLVSGLLSLDYVRSLPFSLLEHVCTIADVLIRR